MNTRIENGLAANGAAAIASVISGSAVVVTSLVVHETAPTKLAFLRYLVAALIVAPFLPFVMPKNRVPLEDVFKLVGLGLIFFAVFPWTFNVALVHTTAARASVAIATLPIQTLCFAWLLRQETVTTRKAMGICLGVTGVILVLAPDLRDGTSSEYLRGDMIMLFTVFCGAAYFVLGRRMIRIYGPLFVTFAAMIFGALALAMMTVLDTGGIAPLRLSAAGWAGVVYLGTVGGVGQFLLFSWAIKYLESSHTALFAAITPLSALILSWLVFDDQVTPFLIIGLIFVTSGIFLNATAKND